MVPEENSSTRSRKFPDNLSAVLASACLEWLLIVFLFIDAALSYAIAKFARRYKLQIPCLLCSRLDRVLGKAKLGYCWDLICSGHKSEISSLVRCRAHGKLVNVHGLCENCRFSFATIDKSNSETYRLLVGKLGEESHPEINQDPLLGHEHGSPTTWCCTCCDETWVARKSDERLVLTKSMSSKAAELDALLCGVVETSFPALYNEGKLLSSSRNIHFELDPLSRIGYTELKINSDIESEVSLSDDNSGRVHETDNITEDLTCAKTEPSNMVPVDAKASEEIVASASASELCSDVHLNHTETHASTSHSAGISESNEDSLGELNWQHAEPSQGFSTHNDLPTDLEELSWQQAESSAYKPDPSGQVSLRDLPASGEKDAPAEVSKDIIDDARANEVELNCGRKAMKDSEEANKGVFKLTAVSETDSETNTSPSGVGHQASNVLDLGDAYKLAMGNRGRQLSGKLAEQWLAKDSSRVSEDLMQMLSQLSASRRIERSVSEKLFLNSDETKTSDASNYVGIQILHSRISLERNDSSLSLDGSISEIEGESDIDRCKRQIEHYKKVMSALYKELEEERSASAIAASQAMAMITKLQEEKATINMEALQYLRMMDEQSQYDMEALQKANDLLAEKDKELQDLEVELELYRSNFPNGSTDPVEKIYELKVTDIGFDNQESSSSRKDETGLETTVLGDLPISGKAEESYICFQDKDMVSGTTKNPLLDFEDERLYLLQCLKNLEKHCHLVENSYTNIGNERPNQIGESTKEDCEGELLETSGKGENGLQMSLEGNAASFGDHDFRDQKVELKLDDRDRSGSLLHGGETLASIETMVSDLNLRLQGLELDRDLLEHTINLLRDGDEGLKLIQDIANSLRELQGIQKSTMG